MTKEKKDLKRFPLGDKNFGDWLIEPALKELEELKKKKDAEDNTTPSDKENTASEK